MAITLNALQKQRRDTASNWTSNNTVLLAGEIGWETDTRKIKIGDGTTAWQSLDYLPIPDVNRLLTGNLTVGGDFQVNGTTTTVNTSVLDVEDKNISLGKVSTPTDTTADGGGITLKGATDKTFNWLDATDSWTSSENIAIPDNKKFTAGDNQDLQLFHDGSKSEIKNLNVNVFTIRQSFSNGFMFIHADQLQLRSHSTNQLFISCTNSGSVQLYHANVKKVETSADGLDLPDNSKLQLGDSQDLEIYHSGNGSFIKDAGDGPLQILTNHLLIRNAANNEEMIVASENGSVELYHNDVKKIETSANGVDVTGTVDLSSAESNSSNTSQFKLSNLTIGQHQNVGSYRFANAGTGSFLFTADNINFFNKDVSKNLLRLSTSAVELYHDNVKKAETSATGFDVTGSITGTGNLTIDTNTLHVDSTNNRVGIGTLSPVKAFHNALDTTLITGTAPQLRLNSNANDGNDNDRAILGLATANSHFFNSAAAGDTILRTTATGSLLFGIGGTEKVRINNNGLGIGITNPTAPFHIQRSGTSQNLAIFESDLGTNNNRSLIIGSPTSDSISEPFRISTGNAIAFEIDGSQKLLIDSSGNIVATGTISGTLANGVVATTQSASDNSTKVATTAYVDNQVSSAGGGISNVVEDTSPSLGGNLDMQSNNITGTGNINTTGQIGRDSNDYIAFTDNTQLDVYINGNNEFRFEADGDFHADGDVIAESTTIASDEKLKENINLIDNPIEKIKQIRGVTFDWKRDGKKSAGVIAQDIEKILPEAVKEVQGLKDDESYKTVNYNSLISILIESVKELTARVEELEAK